MLDFMLLLIFQKDQVRFKVLITLFPSLKHNMGVPILTLKKSLLEYHFMEELMEKYMKLIHLYYLGQPVVEGEKEVL